jgi:hypothetical protein
MRFRKSISLGKGIKLNLSKSGMSTTLGVKGLSVNIGKNGAYLNTGIPGTGLYDRKKIGGSMSNDDNAAQYADSSGFIPPYKTFNGFISFLFFIAGVLFILTGLALLGMSDSTETVTSRLIILPIGIVLFFLHCANHSKAKKNSRTKVEAERIAYEQAIQAQNEILEAKLNMINTNERFEGCKIFTIDYNNIIAFSPRRCIAVFTGKDDETMRIIGVDRITKITQEIKAGDCFAHIFTDEFENNVIDLYLGNAHGKDETDHIRKLYNEIKNMYSVLKKQKS